MNAEKQIQLLISENEFLQLQLEDLNRTVQKRNEEIVVLGEDLDTAAALQSSIDRSVVEIEQFRYNAELADKKAEGCELLNESLENELLTEMRTLQRGEKELHQMESLKANISAVNDELELSAGMYGKLQQAKKDLAEALSNNALLNAENQSLKDELSEMSELNQLLRLKNSKALL